MQVASFDRKSCLVEIKGGDHGIVEGAAAAALSSPLPRERLIWIGFDIEVMASMKRRLPQYQVYHVVNVVRSSPRARPAEVRQGTAKQMIDAAAAAGLDGIDFDADLTLVTPAVLAHARAAGLAVGVWVSKSLPGCDLLPSWREFAERGVDFFTSDLPPAVWEWDRARARRPRKAAI